MPKISTSLAIAFAVHVLIVILSNFLIDKPPSPFLLETKNAINLQMGTVVGDGAPKKSGGPKSSPVLSSKKILTPMSTSLSGAAPQQFSSPGSENGNGNGSGDGNGQTYDFGNSAISYKEPIYPRMAIKRELQGSVRLRVKVSPEGKPTNTEILKSSDHEILDKAALEAVSFWQFQPKDLSYFVEKTIIFQLKN